MSAQPVTSRPTGGQSVRAKKSNLSSPVASPPVSPSINPGNGNGGDRGERTETSTGASKTWERSDMHAPKPSKEIVFALQVGQAQEVQLVGNFTDWQKNPIKLRQATDGSWRTKVILPAGRHLYRYLVDGQWHDDPAHGERVPNVFGSSDLVIDVV
jgi:hypothetical protein